MAQSSPKYHFFRHNEQKVVELLGKERLIAFFQQMLLIRKFESTAEEQYKRGLIGGFFHSYIGQEAIQTAAVGAIGCDSWWATTYRCHALALLLGATPDEIMKELFGRAAGNAGGRGGSMHLYTDRLLGGFGIVGGQIPIGTGAAFSLKYLGKQDRVAMTFMGEGAVAQGAFHESLNIASLWNLPAVYVIENNQWGMGTAASRAISVAPIAENFAKSYGMTSYTIDGQDFIHCYGAFEAIKEEVLSTSRPVLVEVITERFRGHSVSDPGNYRTKEELAICMKRDPLTILSKKLIDLGFITEAEIKEMGRGFDSQMEALVTAAEKSPWPDLRTLGEDVYAPDSFTLKGGA